MKILFLAPDKNLTINMNGGAGTHMRAMIHHLRNRGHEVTVAVGGDLLVGSYSTYYQAQTQSIKNGTWKKLVPTELKKTYKDYRLKEYNKIVTEKVEEIFKDNAFDVIYERTAYGYDTGKVLSERYNIPYVLESDVVMLDLMKKDTSYIFNKFTYRKLEKEKYHSADAIVVQSDYSVPYCKKYWGITEDKVYNKDLGIDIRKSVKGEKNIKEFYQIQDKFVVSFVGYFMKYQNIHLLLQAAKKLAYNEEIVFMLVGSGNMIDSFKKFVKRNELKNVIFTGLVDKTEVPFYYDAIDLAVITDCAHHMYPVKFLEYAQFKLPTIIPRYEMFREFFVDHDFFMKTSFVPKNVDAFTNSIIGAHSAYDEFVAGYEYTFDYVKENKTWAKSGEKLEAIFNKLVPGARNHTPLNMDNSDSPSSEQSPLPTRDMVTK